MFKIEIKSNDVLTNYAEFATELEAQAWLDAESANGSFGKIQREVKEIKSVDSEGVESAALITGEDIALSISVRNDVDSFGRNIRYHTLPAEFTSQITNITAEVKDRYELAESKVALQLATELTEIIRTLNKKKLATGAWTTQIFQSFLTSTLIAQAERALKNASLGTYKSLILNATEFYTGDEITSIIDKVVEHETKWAAIIAGV